MKGKVAVLEVVGDLQENVRPCAVLLTGSHFWVDVLNNDAPASPLQLEFGVCCCLDPRLTVQDALLA